MAKKKDPQPIEFVAISSRMRNDVLDRLRETVEQRSRIRKYPFLIQDIITEAVEQWLDREATG